MSRDEVINHDGRRAYNGRPAEVEAFLKSVKTPMSVLRVIIGATDRTVSAETYLKSRQYIQERALRMEQPSSELINQHYEMNPSTETLLYTSGLRIGMRVLIEEDGDRANLEWIDRSPADRSRALKYNRWCTVSNLQRSNDGVTFIGVYDDDTKITHSRSKFAGWYVKLDSVPDDYDEDLQEDAIEEAIDIVRAYLDENELDLTWINEAEKKRLLEKSISIPVEQLGTGKKARIKVWLEKCPNM